MIEKKDHERKLGFRNGNPQNICVLWCGVSKITDWLIDMFVEGIEFKLPRATKNFYVDGHIPQPH